MMLVGNVALEVASGTVEFVSLSFEAGPFLGVFRYFEPVIFIYADDLFGRLVLCVRFGALLVTMVQQFQIFEVWFFANSRQFFKRMALRFLFHIYRNIINHSVTPHPNIFTNCKDPFL